MASNGTGPTRELVLYDIYPGNGACPYAQRAWLALEVKHLPYKKVLFKVTEKPEDFLKLIRRVTSNDKHRGTVPVLVDGVVELAESLVVVEYLDLAYPGSGAKLLPADPVKYAQVKLFGTLFQDEFQGPYGKALRSATLEEVEEGKEGLKHGLKVLNDFIRDHGSDKGGDFFLGGDYSYAEIVSVPFVYRANLTLAKYRNFDLAKYAKENGLDRFSRWLKANLEHSALKATLPDDEAILEGTKKWLKV